MSNNDYSKSAMIALLPMTTDWSQIELPHMTLVYAGEVDKLEKSQFNEMAKDASTIATLTRPITLRVTDTDIFGDEEKVNVLKLQPTSELLAMRRMVERWNASKHPFNPHATIGPIGTYLGERPSMLAFDRVLVQWGEENLTFWMKR